MTSRIAAICLMALLAGCGQGLSIGSPVADADTPVDSDILRSRGGIQDNNPTTIGEALRAGRNQERIVAVNKYLWSASIEVLDFLPIQSVDPFTGVIITGYGTPPGGGTAYRATVLIDDPALDARSLNVALQTRNGRAASASAVRAVEDAILTRARQLRIGADSL